MAENSKIEWTDATWNPVVGCSVVSPGCTNCYAMRMAGTRLKTTKPYSGLTQDTKAGPVWTGAVRFLEERLTQPLKWRKPRRVFVNSMGDLFHEDVPDDWIDKVFAVMAASPRHTFQVLTKRPERMREHVLRLSRTINPLEAEARAFGHTFNFEGHSLLRWPIPNIWLGTSVEDQRRADERMPHLLNAPAAVRFLSCEPLLGPIDLREVSTAGVGAAAGNKMADCLHWVIAGGESGPRARGMDPAWPRSIRDQCREAGVPFFMKQMSRKAPIPADLMVREFPRSDSAPSSEEPK
ncbi:MAG TPA: phage Gp37/Gp68 family protein [Aurantimonas coralicida]|uniref:Phage Gp37/Gp68 family protein n=2 Tax=root TaxID=1 RepID=A0A9C9NFQ1_9HYPH|nr:phage Gp37/Gp68 family protein [Aurantimonas coralicida]HEU00524.1 phage Gp37/Gp68 family protein [Aurantimonas coralicida]